MQIQLEKHVNPDGTIDLGQVKTSLPESNVKIVIIIEPYPDHPSWSAGFLDKYYGCLADVNLQEPDESGVPTRHHRKWYPTTVKNVIERAAS